jgi:hypothetical protein
MCLNNGFIIFSLRLFYCHTSTGAVIAAEYTQHISEDHTGVVGFIKKLKDT